jgi:hypothetical protein
MQLQQQQLNDQKKTEAQTKDGGKKNIPERTSNAFFPLKIF